jgi:hypothetical protein
MLMRERAGNFRQCLQSVDAFIKQIQPVKLFQLCQGLCSIQQFLQRGNVQLQGQVAAVFEAPAHNAGVAQKVR